jgi:hypothetical protein
MLWMVSLVHCGLSTLPGYSLPRAWLSREDDSDEDRNQYEVASQHALQVGC